MHHFLKKSLVPAIAAAALSVSAVSQADTVQPLGWVEEGVIMSSVRWSATSRYAALAARKNAR